MSAPRVLVVDDVEAHRFVMSSWLRKADFDVVEAASGAEAIARVDPSLDAVVLDIHLPDMTGYDVCAAIKGAGRTAMIPVLHVSATAIDTASRARGLDGGADGYMIEPLDAGEFVATVRALARAREARRVTDQRVAKLTQLAAVTLPLNAADSLTRLLEAAAAGASELCSRPAIAVAGNSEGGVSRALCPGAGEQVLLDVGGPPLVQLWGEASAVVRAAEAPSTWKVLLDRAGLEPTDWFVLPLTHGKTVAGGLALKLPSESAALPEGELVLLERLARAMSVALSNVLAFTEEHKIALTLQRALLPHALPIVPGLTFEARYFASGERVSVGGDFYDVFELDTGEVAAVIGDVQGHSLRAATVMAELRFSLRAYLGEAHAPVTALRLLDDLMLRNHPDETATVALLRFARDRSRVEIANAGHVPPLLVEGSTARFLDHGEGTLLGIGIPVPASAPVPLPASCALVLVTDGLIERRDEDIDASLEALRFAAAETGATDAAMLADSLLEQFASGPLDDDVAILVIGVHPGS